MFPLFGVFLGCGFLLFGAAPIGKDPSDERNSILAHMAIEMGYTEWEWDLLANLAAWLPNRHHGDWQQAWCDVWRFLELFYKIEVQEPEDERENPDHDETEKMKNLIVQSRWILL